MLFFSFMCFLISSSSWRGRQWHTQTHFIPIESFFFTFCHTWEWTIWRAAFAEKHKDVIIKVKRAHAQQPAEHQWWFRTLSPTVSFSYPHVSIPRSLSLTASDIGIHLILGVKDAHLLVRNKPYFQGRAAMAYLSLSKAVCARNHNWWCVCLCAVEIGTFVHVEWCQSFGLEYAHLPPPAHSGAWIKVDLREAKVGGEQGFITLIAMPTTHNETHYRADVVRLGWLKRHEQPYRSEESGRERPGQGWVERKGRGAWREREKSE